MYDVTFSLPAGEGGRTIKLHVTFSLPAGSREDGPACRQKHYTSYSFVCLLQGHQISDRDLRSQISLSADRSACLLCICCLLPISKIEFPFTQLYLITGGLGGIVSRKDVTWWLVLEIGKGDLCE